MRDIINRYNSLSSLIIKTYIDVALFESISTLNDPKSSDIIVFHYCNLIKQDACLNIWKLFFDRNKLANTLKTFNTLLYKSKIKSKTKLRLSEDLKSYESIIKNVRQKVIAHNDAIQNETNIPIEVLKRILDELRTMLNGMGKDINDDSIIQITDSYVFSIFSKVKLTEYLKHSNELIKD